MNVFGFVSLMMNIYGNKVPDIKKIQKQGLLAVKIGQHYALRIDFLNKEKCMELSKLYRAVAAIPPEASKQLIAKYTTPEWRDAFETIDYTPLGSASVGQAHLATLKTGERVVVKLIKGDFKARFIKDVDAVINVFKTAIFFYPKLSKVFDPVGVIEAIRDYTVNELNLKNEIKGQKVLTDIKEKALAAGYAMPELAFPKMYPELTNENILVSEYIDGKTLDELLEKGQLPYDEILKLFHIHGYFMFCEGTFHGDIHPGNIIMKDGALYFIDSAAIAHAGQRLRTGLFNFMEALAFYDYEKCAVYLNEMAEKRISGKAFEAFRVKLLDLYKDFTDSTVGEISLTQKMMETIKLGVLSGMEFENGMFPIIKSLMYMDGMVLKCKPDAVLMKDMRRFIGEFKAMIK